VSDFVDALYAGGFVWLFPSAANMALKIDVKNGNISIAEPFQGICEHAFSERDWMRNNYLGAHHDEGAIYAFASKTRQFVRYDFKTGHLSEKSIDIPKTVQESFITSWVEEAAADTVPLIHANQKKCERTSDCNYYENINFSLQDLLLFVSQSLESDTAQKISVMQKAFFHENTANSEGNAGLSIYRYCKQDMGI
jgi:hypothetical protein